MSLFLLPAFPASADHTAFFPVAWSNNEIIGWTVDPDVPSNAWNNRISDAIAEWDSAVQDQEPEFFAGATSLEVPTVLNPCSSPAELGFGIQELDNIPGATGMTAALEIGCVQQANLDRTIRSIVAFDVAAGSASSWYVRSGDPANADATGQLDLGAAATHEIGHVLGWGPHWDEGLPSVNSICPDDNTRRTMCSRIRFESNAQRTVGNQEFAQYHDEYPHP